MNTASSSARNRFFSTAFVSAAMTVMLCACPRLEFSSADDHSCPTILAPVPPPFDAAPAQDVGKFAIQLSAGPTPDVTEMHADGSGGLWLFGTASQRPWVGRFDRKGHRLWENSLEIDAPLHVAAATSDGHVVIVAAALANDPTPPVAYWLAADGTVTATVDLPPIAGLAAVAVTEDGLLVAGASAVERVDATGAAVWSVALAPETTATGEVLEIGQLAARADGSCIVTYWAGTQADQAAGKARAKALALHADGTMMWRYDYQHDDPTYGDYATSGRAEVVLSPTGDVFMVGATPGAFPFFEVGFIEKVAPQTGESLAKHVFPEPDCDGAVLQAVVVAPDGTLDVAVDREVFIEFQGQFAESFFVGRLDANLQPLTAFAIPFSGGIDPPPARIAQNCLVWLDTRAPPHLLRVPTATNGCP